MDSVENSIHNLHSKMPTDGVGTREGHLVDQDGHDNSSDMSPKHNATLKDRITRRINTSFALRALDPLVKQTLAASMKEIVVP